MGQPVKIVELAERLIQLSGLQVGRDIDIVFSGMRPGERLNEILFTDHEPTIEIGVEGVMAAMPHEPSMQAIRKWISVLETAIARDDRAAIKSVLVEAVPEFGGLPKPVISAVRS
jgi:O-antigen biosynthesis protein WbqV